MQDLQGKVAVVTGAGKNIGRAIARQLAADGASVAVNGRTDRAAVEAVVAEIRAAGGTAFAAMGDVSSPADAAAITATAVREGGGLDILVCNAGLRRQTPFLEMDFAEWREVLSVALDGAFLLTRAAVPHMLQGGGAVVALSGISTHVGTPNRCHVSASKAGLEGFIRGIAKELAPHGITCNCVAPGAIDTLRGAAAGADPGRGTSGRGYRSDIPAGRLGTVDEIAAMVRFLVGPGGAYVTGQTVHVNGGVHLT